jgi:hypothetical protein
MGNDHRGRAPTYSLKKNRRDGIERGGKQKQN